MPKALLKKFKELESLYGDQYDFCFDHTRHLRMWSFGVDEMPASSDTTVLVVGDARDCLDAKFLSVLSDANISSSTLFDRHIRPETTENFNVRDIDLENQDHLESIRNKFDYIVCKEVLHHVKSPLITMRDISRLAKKGVICIEPADRMLEPALMSYLFSHYKRLVRRDHLYEAEGNYLYCFSKREIEKFFLGSFEKADVICTWFNDLYIIRFKPLKSGSFFFRVALALVGGFNAAMEFMSRASLLKPTHIVIHVRRHDAV